MITANYPIGKLWKSIQKSLFPELEEMVSRSLPTESGKGLFFRQEG